MIQADKNHSPFALEFPTEELRYRSIFQLAPHAAFVLDAKAATVLEVNRQCCTLLGYSRDAMLALHVDALSNTGERFSDVVRRAAGDEPGWISHHIAAKGGELVGIDLHVVQAIILGARCIVVWARPSERNARFSRHMLASQRGVRRGAPAGLTPP